MTEIQTQDFSYDLPRELVAYVPAELREEARLMVLKREGRTIRHTRFREITRYLRKGDVLVLNETRVIRARLRGEKRPTGGRVDLLLLREAGRGSWEALVSPGRRIHVGTEILIAERYGARVTGRLAGGKRVVEFETDDVMALLEDVGEVPLPPYIKRAPQDLDRERYQTVYAERNGSVAAPTAGLHFTKPLLEAISRKGVEIARLTLHVGLGSFRPVKEPDPTKHVLDPEYFEIDDACAGAVNRARNRGGRVVAVGTTTVRALETAAERFGRQELLPGAGWTEKMILPPYRFRFVDVLVTNFHLPRSTLLMLVSAFAGRRFVLEAYGEAVRRAYRFYSYGDAMIII